MTDILIVDDDPGIQDTLASLFELYGLKSVTASNGREALKIISENTPSVILLDLMMPVMNGWQFLKEKCANPNIAGIPVVVMTAGIDEVPAGQAVAILRKPMAMDDLMAAINNYVQSQWQLDSKSGAIRRA